jgi:hypothetical protein
MFENPTVSCLSENIFVEQYDNISVLGHLAHAIELYESGVALEIRADIPYPTTVIVPWSQFIIPFQEDPDFMKVATAQKSFGDGHVLPNMVSII